MENGAPCCAAVKKDLYNRISELERMCVNLEGLLSIERRNIRLMQKQSKKSAQKEPILHWIVDHYFALEEQIRMIRFQKKTNDTLEEALNRPCMVCNGRKWVFDYNSPGWKSDCFACSKPTKQG